jgi:uncharacterized protein YndB with AHSA1/START domain
MSLLIRILQIVAALALLAGAVLWFAARRGDRGFIEEEVTIARPAPAVFHWISSEDLARRWISDVIELQRTGEGGPQTATFRLVQLVDGHRVDMNLRVAKVVPNQELSLLISSGNSVSEGFFGDANFKLITNGEYTRLVFSSHAQFVSLSDRVFEPVLTIAMQRKIRDDLANLKILAQAESERSANPRASLWCIGNLGNYILSMIPAAPIPPPMHMVTMP